MVPALVGMVDKCDREEQKILAETLSRVHGQGIDAALAAALAKS
jgi:hypothetical protein